MPPDDPPKLVLVVEDYADTRLLYCEALRTAGFEVEEAEDGASAVEKAKHRRFDLILLDIGLPGIDGFEVAHEIRRNADAVGVPVVVLSAYVHRTNATELAAKAGAIQALPKPCGPEELVTAVKAIFARE